MEYFIICLAALLGSGLTLFSGFGLGTILVPVFALFFPIDIAITLTAIVHFLNNLFKLALLGKKADKAIVFKFGVPSILAAFAGAYLLTYISHLAPLFDYTFMDNTFYVMPVKLTIAVLLFIFSLFDLVPKLSNLQFDMKYLPLGGLLSGFFGGLSGNQGALRTAFLVRANLSKEAFIGTGVVIACLVDISRLTVYANQLVHFEEDLNYGLLISATVSAFIGAYFGHKLLKKITLKTVQVVVAGMLMLFAVLLGLGMI